MLEKFERIKLGHFPTPIEHLKNITKYLGGPNIFIKRDDCTGLATGGNKTRKLEFLIPDAIKNKTEIVVTVGAVQSNHARQTAAACTLMGLKCLIILEQRIKNPPDAYMNSGNIFLDKLFGADIKICPRSEDVLEYSSKVIEDLKSKGTNVYFIPAGGANSIGTLGYVECLNEIIRENNKYNFSQIVHATGSSGTQAGLLAGRKYFNCNIPVTGISVRFDKKTQEEKVYTLAKETCEMLQCNTLDKSEVVVYDDYIGSGYGEPTDGMIEATKLLAKKEAILLDPVYSGKAFAGLIGDEGKGFPLVLVHGFLGSSKMWEPQIDFFKDRFRVITPDLPGFGKSNEVKSHNSIQSIANLLLNCLEEKKIDKFYLLGHSMGGMIVQEMAKKDGDKILKLVCYSTGPRGEMPGRFETVEQSRENLKKSGLEITAKNIAKTWFIKGEDAKYFDICIEAGKQSSMESADNALIACKNWNGVDTLKNIKNETLIVWGDQDKSYNLEQIQILEHNIENSKLIIFKNCAHNVHLEQPGQFNNTVKDFLS